MLQTGACILKGVGMKQTAEVKGKDSAFLELQRTESCLHCIDSDYSLLYVSLVKLPTISPILNHLSSPLSMFLLFVITVQTFRKQSEMYACMCYCGQKAC